jgi:hypothetical protein
VEKNRRDVEERAEQLKSIGNLSALLAGFAVVSFLEFSVNWESIELVLEICFGFTTALVVWNLIYMHNRYQHSSDACTGTIVNTNQETRTTSPRFLRASHMPYWISESHGAIAPCRHYKSRACATGTPTRRKAARCRCVQCRWASTRKRWSRAPSCTRAFCGRESNT